MQHILLIEDNAQISRFLQLELELSGYKLTCCADGQVGYELLLQKPFDLLILDYMLPGMSGLEICRLIRPKLSLPIIMLTARDNINDKVALLDAGADDYLTKPFAIEELLARIRVQLRSSSTTNTGTADYIHRQIEVFLAQRCVRYQEKNIELTKTEFDLLVYLLQNKNIVLTREQIINNVWGYDYVGDTNIVDVYIRYLRSKIDMLCNEKIVQTVRGIGYVIKD